MVSEDVLIVNFLLGLLASFSPCLFPLLPSYVAITVRSKLTPKNTIISSFFLIAGILVVFFSLGLVTDKFGQFLLNNYSSFAKMEAILLFLAGILMIKTPSLLYKIKLPDRFERHLYSENEARNPFIFSFLVGLAYTVIATPCAAGFFLVSWDYLIGESFLNQFFIVLAFSLGAGLPFIVMSFYVPQVRGNVIDSLQNANQKITTALGVILILISIWLFSEVGTVPVPTID
ncbi:MAG: cytochrome c biogenesis CcdA family protein [Candidatus Kariarchaeaceae archaeon]